MTDNPDPLELDMKPSKRRKMRQDAKKKQEYDPAPPRCKTCKHFCPEVNKGFIHVPHCRLGHFAVDMYGQGLCKEWAGLDGSTLE